MYITTRERRTDSMEKLTEAKIKGMFITHINESNERISVNYQNYTAHEVLEQFKGDWKREFKFWLDEQIHHGKIIIKDSTYYSPSPTKRFRVQVEIRRYEIREIEIDAKNKFDAKDLVVELGAKLAEVLGNRIESGLFHDDSLLISGISEVTE